MSALRYRGGIAMLAGLVLIVSAVTGCGDDDGTAATTDPPTTETTAPETTETTAPETTETTAAPDTTEATSSEVDIYLLVDGGECDETEAVTRQVDGDATLEAALNALLAGPTPEEEAEGLGGWFSADTDGMLQSATIAGGDADVSFDADLRSTIPNASTACGSLGFLAQLDQTVEQFDEVDRVFYALDGDVDAFYEWLQFSAPPR
jgi:spore germination protein GerM